MNHCMLDLEALDSNRSGVLVSIGAQMFDLGNMSLGDTYYCEISLSGMEDQRLSGRTINLDTVCWWMQQSDSARKVFFPDPERGKLGTRTALKDFGRFLTSYSRPKVWGNGVDFDNVFLRDVYESYSIPCPWHYTQNRCYRTVKNMFPNVGLKREGAHHNALDDATTQAKHLIEIWKYAKKQK